MTASNATSSRTDRPADPPASGGCSSSTAERFTLSGPSSALDPRIHAYRRDIADIALAGRIIAPHYARPAMRTVGQGGALLRAHPSAGAETVAELAPREMFAMLDLSGGWAWGYRRDGHQVGYVEVGAFVAPASVLD